MVTGTSLPGSFTRGQGQTRDPVTANNPPSTQLTGNDRTTTGHDRITTGHDRIMTGHTMTGHTMVMTLDMMGEWNRTHILCTV